MDTNSHFITLDAENVDNPPVESQDKTEPLDSRSWDWLEASPGKLAAALLFGVVFGFLLQKGGVAKFDILLGVLLLENFVVVKVMLTAILVGMIGSFGLRAMGVIELKIGATNYGAQIMGGLLFGVGFGLLAYCPGTNAAAVGQGNFDALTGVVGLLLGSYVYALSSKYGIGAINQWGKRGKITLPHLLGVSEGVVVAITSIAIVVVLVLLESTGR